MQDQPIFRASLAIALGDILPLVNKLHRSGRVPHDVRTVAPISGLAAALVELLGSVLPVAPAELEARILGTSEIVNFDLALSRVLLVGRRVVAGGLAYRVGPESAFLYAVVVAPGYRRSWATPIVKHAVFAAMAAAGIAWIEFMAANRTADTLNHARRIGAAAIGDQYFGVQPGE